MNWMTVAGSVKQEESGKVCRLFHASDARGGDAGIEPGEMTEDEEVKNKRVCFVSVKEVDVSQSICSRY